MLGSLLLATFLQANALAPAALEAFEDGLGIRWGARRLGGHRRGEGHSDDDDDDGEQRTDSACSDHDDSSLVPWTAGYATALIRSTVRVAGVTGA